MGSRGKGNRHWPEPDSLWRHTPPPSPSAPPNPCQTLPGEQETGGPCPAAAVCNFAQCSAMHGPTPVVAHPSSRAPHALSSGSRCLTCFWDKQEMPTKRGQARRGEARQPRARSQTPTVYPVASAEQAGPLPATGGDSEWGNGHGNLSRRAERREPQVSRALSSLSLLGTE